MTRFWTLLACAAFVSACSGALDVGSTDDATKPSQGSTASPVTCASDPRVQAFAANLQAKSADGRYAIEIVDAAPAPPRRGVGEQGTNVWTVKVTRDGQPVTEPPTVTTQMPDHGHGSPKTPVVQANADGTFTVSTLFFYMAGVWEVTFGPTSGRETATFTLCVP